MRTVDKMIDTSVLAARYPIEQSIEHRASSIERCSGAAASLQTIVNGMASNPSAQASAGRNSRRSQAVQEERLLVPQRTNRNRAGLRLPAARQPAGSNSENCQCRKDRQCAPPHRSSHFWLGRLAGGWVSILIPQPWADGQSFIPASCTNLAWGITTQPPNYLKTIHSLRGSMHCCDYLLPISRNFGWRHRSPQTLGFLYIRHLPFRPRKPISARSHPCNHGAIRPSAERLACLPHTHATYHRSDRPHPQQPWRPHRHARIVRPQTTVPNGSACLGARSEEHKGTPANGVPCRRRISPGLLACLPAMHRMNCLVELHFGHPRCIR